MVETDGKGQIRVFVYGTLKRGHGNHGLLDRDDVEFLGYDSVTGHYKLLNLGSIPGVFDCEEKTSTIYGEVYAVAPEVLSSLDLLEGHPDFYQRRKLWTNRQNVRVWMYHCMADVLGRECPDDEVCTGMWRPSAEEVAFWQQGGQSGEQV